MRIIRTVDRNRGELGRQLKDMLKTQGGFFSRHPFESVRESSAFQTLIDSLKSRISQLEDRYPSRSENWFFD